MKCLREPKIIKSMLPDKPRKILTADEVYDAVIDWFKADDDWVNLVYVVQDTGYDDALTSEQLQDVIEKVMSFDDLVIYDAASPSSSEIGTNFGGNPLPRDVDAAALSRFILEKDRAGLLMALMVVPHPDKHKMPYEYDEE